MLTGNQLGAAIEQARIKKGVTKVALAAAMGVKPASVQDWVKYGRLAKERINDLVEYFSDVVGPDHWGLDFSAATSGMMQSASHEALDSALPDDAAVEIVKFVKKMTPRERIQLLGAAKMILSIRVDRKAKIGKDAA